MTRCRYGALSFAPFGALFLPVLARSVAVRQPEQPASVAARLGRLFKDLDESVRKAGEDSEVAFSQLYSLDQKLKASLEHEIDVLNSTRAKLVTLHAKYYSEADVSKAELQRLNNVVNQAKKSEYQYHSNASKTGDQLEGVLASVSRLMKVIHEVESSASQRLPHEEIGNLQQLLAMHGEMRPDFQDVYVVFEAPPASEEEVIVERVLPRAIFSRTVSLLQQIGRKVRRQQAKVLLQVQSQQQSLATETSEVAARADAARSAQVERERRVEEVTFSTAFTNAAMKADLDLVAKLQGHLQAKAELVDSIRSTRQSQIQTLNDLTDLLNRRYKPPVIQAIGDAAEGNAEDTMGLVAPVSLVQRHAEASGVKKHRLRGASSLSSEIEGALRRKKDTHALLLKIEATLDKAVPIDANNVRDVVANMANALHAVDSVQASADDAKRRCEAQEFRENQEQERLRGSLQLMAASQNHTTAAIRATAKNLHSMEAKARSLNRSTREFLHTTAQAMSTLEEQSHDRATIIAAVRKARVVAPSAAGETATPAAVALLSQLLKQFESQGELESSYRKQQNSLGKSLSAYAYGYQCLLEERRLHYEATLSALNLYASELSSDQMSRKAILNDGDELKDESDELCDSILGFYKRHDERRKQVSDALRGVLPKIPGILGRGD